MVTFSEFRNADDIRVERMCDEEHRRKYERTKLADDVAIKVVQQRAALGISQAELGRRLGMHQANVSRLESGEHEPSLETLARLARVLNLDFSVDVTPERLMLRHPSCWPSVPEHPASSSASRSNT